MEARTARFDQLGLWDVQHNPKLPQEALRSRLCAKAARDHLAARGGGPARQLGAYPGRRLHVPRRRVPARPGPGVARAPRDDRDVLLLLDGRFRIYWGDHGEHEVILERWDTVSVPPGVVRGFQNVSEDVAHLLILVTGGVSDMNDIAMTPEIPREAHSLRSGGRAGARADRPALRRGSRLMIDGIFVFDNAIHCYDMSDENLREDRADAALFARPAARRCGDGGRWAGYNDGSIEFNRRWTIEELYEMVFVDAPTDMAMVQVVPIFDWFKDTFAPVLTQHEMAEAVPGSRPVLRRRRPALPGRRRRARAARLADQGARRALDQVLQRPRRRARGAATTGSSPTRCTSAASSSAST